MDDSNKEPVFSTQIYLYIIRPPFRNSGPLVKGIIDVTINSVRCQSFSKGNVLNISLCMHCSNGLLRRKYRNILHQVEAFWFLLKKLLPYDFRWKQLIFPSSLCKFRHKPSAS
ncbi:hypothetical protein X975_22526, partial [Stegodyphus mimosarum]